MLKLPENATCVYLVYICIYIWNLDRHRVYIWYVPVCVWISDSKKACVVLYESMQFCVIWKGIFINVTNKTSVSHHQHESSAVVDIHSGENVHKWDQMRRLTSERCHCLYSQWRKKWNQIQMRRLTSERCRCWGPKVALFCLGSLIMPSGAWKW